MNNTQNKLNKFSEEKKLLSKAFDTTFSEAEAANKKLIKAKSNYDKAVANVDRLSKDLTYQQKKLKNLTAYISDAKLALVSTVLSAHPVVVQINNLREFAKNLARKADTRFAEDAISLLLLEICNAETANEIKYSTLNFKDEILLIRPNNRKRHNDKIDQLLLISDEIVRIVTDDDYEMIDWSNVVNEVEILEELDESVVKNSIESRIMNFVKQNVDEDQRINDDLKSDFLENDFTETERTLYADFINETFEAALTMPEKVTTTSSSSEESTNEGQLVNVDLTLKSTNKEKDETN